LLLEKPAQNLSNVGTGKGKDLGGLISISSDESNKKADF
jgi:hypothetical protein